MPLSEKIQQINREIGATLERAISDLRQEVSQRLRAGHDEILRSLDDISPELPSSFIPEELGAQAEELARQTARQVAAEAEMTLAERTSGARRSAFTDVRDALAGIDRARSQAEILAALLRETHRFASRAAVLLVRGSELRGWGGQGFGEAEPAIRDLAFAAADGSGWGRLAAGQSAVYLSAAECGELCGRIDAALPREGVMIPLVLRDRVAAGLYADRLDGELAAEALQVLCHTAAMAIELLPFRERPFTPTLALEGEPSGRLPQPAPEPEAAEPSEPEPSPEPETRESDDMPTMALEPAQESAALESSALESDNELDATAVVAQPEPALSAIEPEPEPEPVLAAWAGTAPEPEVEAVAEEAAPEPEPSPAATVYQPIPVPSFQSGVSAFPAAVPALPAEPAPSSPSQPSPAGTAAATAGADQTVLLQRPSSFRDSAAVAPASVQAPVEAPAPPPLRPVPVAEPAPAPAATGGDGTPQVQPPTGVDGPGWAFSASRAAVSPSEEALHEEARRLARLLVSEIKLYNEEQVEEGRRRRDVYERLKEDIDRSRQMYEERVEPRILKSTDYFYQELVRILAAGDAKALGI